MPYNPIQLCIEAGSIRFSGVALKCATPDSGYSTFLVVHSKGVRGHPVFNEKNLYGLCGAECLWLPNSIFILWFGAGAHGKDLLSL